MNSGASLDEIGLKYATDKASNFHDFLNLYERVLATRRLEPVNIIEIGVYDGASVKMWREYFPNGRVVGVDINPAAATFADDGIQIEISDQSNMECLLSICRKYGPFDLIIDDGSHIWDHQILTLQQLFPWLNLGGIYILEDIDTSYGAYEADYRGLSDISAAQYLKNICDYMVGDRVLNLKGSKDPFIRAYASRIEYITFARRTSIIKRR
ncbi:class I SAM-dependent methyltransferase [Nitrospirillum pindoramense]|uniref:Methyltransferase family protein n=1 Tax=Nitrospirillum amazonense TaxID=28077 RepID=A0A560H4G6_9PROT|nr:class I SAM-dependent methyltransferase [Nitrospirillum amazonense]TWB41177.1 methyltransferase family protein [Nitrospirillum amazonense]